MKSAVWLGSMSATSCQWLLTSQQCGSFVGKRLLVEVPFTTFNEGAASAATNQRSSKSLNVTQRLHQTTMTADLAHGTKRVTNRVTHYCCLMQVTKGLIQVPLPFKKPSHIIQDPVVLFFKFTELLVHSRLSNLFTHRDPLQFLLVPL